MKFDRTGLILYTINYEQCVDFYKNILELPIMFTSDMLTCFQLGESYLMVELDDEGNREDNSSHRIKTCIRLNVSDVKSAANRLIEKNIEVDYQEHSWGTIAKFLDPDGNLCAFKDSDMFEKQIEDYRKRT